MSVQELLANVSYVTDKGGNRQAVLLDLAVWEELLTHLILDESVDRGLDEELETEDAIDREMDAFIKMHPMLKQKYFGKHVAIQGGQLVDYDDDGAKLSERIYKKYPNTFVWIAEVMEEPIQTFYMPSTRLIRDDG